MKMDKERALDVLEDNRWKLEPNYGGPDFSEYFIVVSQSRDSGALERSNYEVASELLQPEHGADRETVAQDNPPPVLDCRFGHWAVGWIESLMIHQDAPTEKIVEAAEIVARLADYPVLDEEHYSDTQIEERWETVEKVYLSEVSTAIEEYLNVDELTEKSMERLKESLMWPVDVYGEEWRSEPDESLDIESIIGTIKRDIASGDIPVEYRTNEHGDRIANVQFPIQ